VADAQHPVQRHLKSHERACRARAFNTAVSNGTPEIIRLGDLANGAIVIQRILRRHERVVVRGHHDGNVSPLRLRDDGRRDLAIDVMQMHHIRRGLVEKRGEIARSFSGPERTHGCLEAAPTETYFRGLNRRYEMATPGRRNVFGILHGERHGFVAVLLQESGQLDRVTIGAAFDMPVLVRDDDFHGPRVR
jgi:hypothetical protein